MTESIFLVFGLGFFIFCCHLSIQENRREQSRTDYRADLEYNRQLNERREFGYEAVEDSIRNQKKYFFKK